MVLNHIKVMENGLTPRSKEIRKCGTIKISAVETTPVVWDGRLLRFEWMRSDARDIVHKQRAVGYYQFFDMEN